MGNGLTKETLAQVVGEIPSLYAETNQARLDAKLHELESRFIPGNGGEPDRELLKLLTPHFKQSRRNARRLSALAETENALNRALADRGEALITLNRQGKISVTAGPVAGLFRRYFGQRDRGTLTGLPETVQRWLQRRWLATVNGAVPPDQEPLEILGAEGCLTIRLQADGRKGWRLVLHENNLPSARRFPRHPGLTVRENEIFYWIGVGKSNSDIARLEGISERTVNKHIQNLFAKVGAASRAEAIVSARQLFRLE